jgi:hypothetical protein
MSFLPACYFQKNVPAVPANIQQSSAWEIVDLPIQPHEFMLLTGFLYDLLFLEVRFPLTQNSFNV